MSSIILLGIKHCGKSTQGKMLSKHFSCLFFDTDDEITSLTGKSPREIYIESGKEALLEAEKKVCEALSERFSSDAKETPSSEIDSVIATGGGICANPPALDSLRKIGKFVFLNVDEKTAANRIIWEIKYDSDGSMKNLPAYIADKNPANIQDVRLIFHDFYERRQKIYEDLCDIEIKFGHNASKSENMRKILAALT